MIDPGLATILTAGIAFIALIWGPRLNFGDQPTVAALSPEMLEAMREVDALTPGSIPLIPVPSLRASIERLKVVSRERFLARLLPDAIRENPPPVYTTTRLDLSRLIPPTAHAVGVWPRCNGAGGCGYHHRKGIPCGQALNERRPPPPPAQTPKRFNGWEAERAELEAKHPGLRFTRS